jgi:transcriptional regulator with XRE-family HTH domain
MQGKKNKLAVSVGAVIVEKRKRRGLTQSQLAGLLGITQNSLSRMESGEIAPKLSRLQDIADALGCPVADLFRTASPGAAGKAEAIADLIQGLPEQLQEMLLSMMGCAAHTHWNTEKKSG